MTFPLANKKILITRERKQATSLANLIEGKRGIPIVVPLITIDCLMNEAKIHQVERFQWVFFTSANGVRCLMEGIPNHQLLAKVKIAAVGTKTKQALEQYGIAVDFVPSTFNAETMVAEFFNQYPKANNCLIVRGNRSRDVLQKAFESRHLHYESVTVYETKPNKAIKQDLIQTLQEDIDILTFTSPSTVDTFVSLVQDTSLFQSLRHRPVVSIGTTTERQAKKHQFTTLITPTTFTIEAMVTALEQYVMKH